MKYYYISNLLYKREHYYLARKISEFSKRKTGIEIFNDDNITTYQIVELAKNNDKLAKKALDVWQNDIAIGIVGLINLFDSDCVVLSGSMEKFVDCEKIEKFVNENIVVSPTKIFHAQCENNAGLIGAVLLAKDLLQI